MKGRARCRQVRPLLALAASQDLGERPSRRVWGHLAECMDCRRRYTGYLELRSALTELEPRRPGSARAAGIDGDFFDELQHDILSEVERHPPVARARRAWLGAAGAAALFLVGALAIQGLLPSGEGLLHRDPMAPIAPVGSSQVGPEFNFAITPLAYPQGLGARRQIDLLFEEETGLEVTPASYGASRRWR